MTAARFREIVASGCALTLLWCRDIPQRAFFWKWAAPEALPARKDGPLNVVTWTQWLSRAWEVRECHTWHTPKGRCPRCSDHSFTVIYVAWQLPGLTNAEFLLLVVKQKGCWVFQGSFIPKPEFIGHLLGGDSLILSHTQFFSGDLGGLIPIICPDIMLKKALKVEVND